MSEFFKPSESELNTDKPPILVENFDILREKPNIKPNLEDCEEIFQPLDREHYFNEALKAFLYVFDHEKFIQVLTGQRNAENLAYLKQVRRFGLILKSHYKFFDKAHYAPQNLQDFLQNLGEFNDHYNNSSSDDEVEQTLLVNFTEGDFEFDADDGEGFKKYVKGIFKSIKSEFKDEVITIEEFHKLRKNIRLFANLLQVPAAENLNSDIHWLFTSLHDIHVRLGQEHDEYVQQHIAQEINYHDTEHELNPKDKKRFKKLKPFIKRAVGI